MLAKPTSKNQLTLPKARYEVSEARSRSRTCRVKSRSGSVGSQSNQPQPTTPPSTVKLWPVVHEPAREAR